MEHTDETLKKMLPEIRSIFAAAFPNTNHLTDEKLLSLAKKAYLEMRPGEEFISTLFEHITIDQLIKYS